MAEETAKIKESQLGIRTLGLTDYARIVGSDNQSYRVLLSAFAQLVVQTYAGTSLAGEAQSVKDAIDALQSGLDDAEGAIEDLGQSLADLDTTVTSQGEAISGVQENVAGLTGTTLYFGSDGKFYTNGGWADE